MRPNQAETVLSSVAHFLIQWSRTCFALHVCLTFACFFLLISHYTIIHSSSRVKRQIGLYWTVTHSLGLWTWDSGGPGGQKIIRSSSNLTPALYALSSMYRSLRIQTARVSSWPSCLAPSPTQRDMYTCKRSERVRDNKSTFSIMRTRQLDRLSTRAIELLRTRNVHYTMWCIFPHSYCLVYIYIQSWHHSHS